MSNYTIELRKIPERLIDEALSHYPIFADGYRETLNTRIKQHFWYNEIGHESIDQFLFQLRVKMSEIMPYYNQFYEAEMTKRDPYVTQRVKSGSTSSVTNDMESSESQSSKSGNKSSAKSRARSRPMRTRSSSLALRAGADCCWSSSARAGWKRVNSN